MICGTEHILIGDSSSTQVEWPGAQSEFSDNSGITDFYLDNRLLLHSTSLVKPVRTSRTGTSE